MQHHCKYEKFATNYFVFTEADSHQNVLSLLMNEQFISKDTIRHIPDNSLNEMTKR